MAYDLEFAINFSKFVDETNSLNPDYHPIFKFIGDRLNEYDLDRFNNNSSAWIGQVQYERLIGAEPYESLPHSSFNFRKYAKLVPVFNLTCNFDNELFPKYVDLLKQHILNKYINLNKKITNIRVFISGHGADNMSLGTGDEKLNNGFVSYSSVISILDNILLSSLDLSRLNADIQLISCNAAIRNYHEEFFNLLVEKYKGSGFNFNVTGYLENITLESVLSSDKFALSKTKMKTEIYDEKNPLIYSLVNTEDVSGIRSSFNKIVNEIEKIKKYNPAAISEIFKARDQALKESDQKYNLIFIDILRSLLIDRINELGSNEFTKGESVLCQNTIIGEQGETLQSSLNRFLLQITSLKKAFINHMKRYYRERYELLQKSGC
ncbi:hypothetical protein EDC55_10339 [Allofrancisella inopinata]|uniref:Uncharacterized protein n=1 Tax=Allofrancisella inopinata TaxID=1085647 RepID=A0AAE6YKS2_9GAMM|nr:hypothetical protein [Allofrancisella inopinata]QIV96714.1 hypothetical protein E4K63_07680 [Allofrancisella inopinata]TDT73470.1 hypothetical protein EDC55_10339 [Allofrancisella inopinata]